MNDSNSEADPWSVVGDQPVRMPERIKKATAIRKTFGFVLLGLGGMVMAIFAVYCFALYVGIRGALRFGIRHADNPDVSAITPFDVTMTVVSGTVGLALLAAGCWIFRGSLPRPGKFSD
jgi:hypothetical protein